MSGANPVPTAEAQLIAFSRGLYSIEVLPRNSAAGAASTISLTVPPSLDGATNDVTLAPDGPARDIRGGCGHLTFAEVRSSRGVVLVCTTTWGGAIDPFDIVVAPLAAVSAQAETDSAIPGKLKLRLERLGWRSFSGKGWAKSRNGHLRIFGIGFEADDTGFTSSIEVKAFGSDDHQTDWTGGGHIAGFDAADISLTGFALRLAPGSGIDASVGYAGEFRKAGMVSGCFDGETCRSLFPDDPLVGVRMWISRRNIG